MLLVSAVVVAAVSGVARLYPAFCAVAPVALTMLAAAAAVG